MVEQEDTAKEYILDMENLGIFKTDESLRHYREHFEVRIARFRDVYRRIVEAEGSLVNFAQGYKSFGLLAKEDGVHLREWLPGAKEVYLTGDFNNWDRHQHRASRDAYGHFHLRIPKLQNGDYPIAHGSKVKLHILDANNEWKDKIPAWIHYSIQNDDNKVFDGSFWNPPVHYKWKHPIPSRPSSPKIYECHIGMSGIEPRVHSYKEFTANVLPRVKKLGYNCIQIMAIMEHSYYGSFGYHVTNFFAISSRFGTPEDLKQLIDEAHGLGIFVLMDLVHRSVLINRTIYEMVLISYRHR
jgi:1,4-alpha-glucan branching enzyme